MWKSWKDNLLILVFFLLLLTSKSQGILNLFSILQIKDEVKGVLDFISYTYGIFGFTFELELSTVHLFMF